MEGENMKDREEVLAIVHQLNIIDNTLFQKMAEDIDVCEEMISTIMEQKIKVKKVVPQNSIRNLQGRSVVLDALCETEDGKEFNVEVQKADDDDHQKRVRYNTSCVTANITEPGTKFEKVPDVAGLMRIFKEPDAYDFKRFPKVSKRKKQFKESEGGDETMCDLVENYAKKKATEEAVKEAKDSALRLFQNGANYELVRASIVLLSDEELQEIYKKAKNG